VLPVKLRHLGRSRHDHGEQSREVAMDGASAGASRETARATDRRIDGQNAGGAGLEQPAEIRDGVEQRGARRRGWRRRARRAIASVHGSASTSGT
jgi:hypothetical protein